MSENQSFNKQIKIIVLMTVVFGALSILISLFYFKSLGIALGVLFGLTLGLSNFIFLTKIVVKMLSQNYKQKPLIALFFLLKILFIIGLVGVSFWHFKVDKMAFVVGYLCLIISITLGQFFVDSNQHTALENK